MALGDGIRRNIMSVSQQERDRFRDAIIALNNKFFPGSRNDFPAGRVSYWFKQDEIHQATHVHGTPAFNIALNRLHSSRCRDDQVHGLQNRSGSTSYELHSNPADPPKNLTRNTQAGAPPVGAANFDRAYWQPTLTLSTPSSVGANNGRPGPPRRSRGNGRAHLLLRCSWTEHFLNCKQAMLHLCSQTFLVERNQLGALDPAAEAASSTKKKKQ